MNNVDKIKCDCGKIIDWNDWTHKDNCLEYHKINCAKEEKETLRLIKLIKLEQILSLSKQILIYDNKINT